MQMQRLAFGEPSPGAAPSHASYLPMFAHLALVLTAGVYFPSLITLWFQNVARLLG
jgi:hydrogenase-4 component F